MMNYCLGESDLEGGSAGKCFLYCEFGFVYKVIHIPSRTVAGDVLSERDKPIITQVNIVTSESDFCYFTYSLFATRD